LAPMSPRPRMRPPVDTQMKRMSFSGQLRNTSAMRRVLPVVLPDFHFVTCELPMAPVRMM
jgi:hypothetical protein